jgi:serine/threonine protein kinase
MIGKTVREFEIQSELGAGAFGAVYRAFDKSVNRDVAIKVILPQYANDPDFQQRFEHEAQLVAQLESRQIVPLYSYWQDERGAFLVMRYIRGGSLRRIMAKQDALSLSQTVRIVADIAEALAVAHENNVIHRDLKPENVLIDERGNAYLTDFGIAKRTTDADNITDADVIIGTLAYLAPEQIQSAAVSPQTDIYAFGIMLYEMLVGKHPFHGSVVAAMLMKHLQEPLPDIHDLRPDLPQQLDDIIQSATAKDPQDRYASTLDLLADLKMVANVMNTTILVKRVKKKTPGTSEERNRQAMLENVRSFWIKGVLENNLHDAAMLDLGLKAEAGAVDNPWDTLLRTAGGEENITDANIIDVFDRMNGKLLILGDPGSGKTTTLLTLARELLNRAESDNHHPIPVVFNLSSWSEKRLPLTQWLVEELYSKYQVPRKVSEKWIADEELLLLLDGLDEVAGEKRITDEELLLLLDGLDEVAKDARNACVTAINNYREQHGFVDVVVCSRIKDYDALHEQLRLNGAIVIQPLDDEQIMTYLAALGNDVVVVRELIKSDAQLRELAQSPLMLSIMILAYRGKMTSDIPDIDDLETERQHLFNVYVERMFERRIGGKQYTKEETKHYLGWLAHSMQQQAQSLFQIEALQPTVIPQSQRVAFYQQVGAVHVVGAVLNWSLSAILVAIVLQISVALLLLSWGLIGGTWVGWTYSGDGWKQSRSHLILGVIYGISITAALWAVMSPTNALILGILIGVGIGASSVMNSQIYLATGGDRDPIPLIEKVQFSLKNINRLQYMSIAMIAFSILVAAPGALFVRFNLPVRSFFLGWLTMIVQTIPTLLVLSGLGFEAVPVRHTSKRRVRTTFRTVALITSITSLVAIPGFMILALVMGISLMRGFLLGTAFGVSGFGYALWTVMGGIGVYRHWMLRRTLTNHGYLPYNVARFLNYATSLVLMRKVGGGYIFIHRYLLEYFAALYRGK